MACRKGKKRRFIGALIGALLLAATSFGGCLQDGGVFKSSLNCTGLPTIDKYYDPMTFSRNSSLNIPVPYLVINSGNDLEVWRVNTPDSPIFVTSSNFHIPNQGDSNHDLIAYSVCDDCRWGAASFKLGNVLFDFGSGTLPSFDRKLFYPSARPYGVFTFKYSGQQYLLANRLPGDCGKDATLYKFDDINKITAIDCVDVPGISTSIAGGVKVKGGDGVYLYLGFSSAGVYVYKVEQAGGAIRLTNTGSPPLVAYMSRGKGLSVDSDAKIAVTASFGNGLRIYSVSNPASPQLLSSVPGTFTVAAVRYPFAWTARLGYTYSERTFLIEDPSHPVELDTPFWGSTQPWNNHSDQCEYPNGAVFSLDATTMYLARHAVAQMIDFSDCYGEPPPPTPTPEPTCPPGCVPE